MENNTKCECIYVCNSQVGEIQNRRSCWGVARFQEFAKQYTKYTHEASSSTATSTSCLREPGGGHSNVPLLIDFYFIFIRSTRRRPANPPKTHPLLHLSQRPPYTRKIKL